MFENRPMYIAEISSREILSSSHSWRICVANRNVFWAKLTFSQPMFSLNMIPWPDFESADVESVSRLAPDTSIWA